MLSSPSSMDDKVAFYNALWAQQWQDMERYNPTARHLEREIIKLVRGAMPLKSLMEAGCGMGVNLKPLREAFPDLKLTGTDLSDDILKIAKGYVGEDSGVEYVSLDLEKRALDRTFDLILCTQVL